MQGTLLPPAREKTKLSTELVCKVIHTEVSAFLVAPAGGGVKGPLRGVHKFLLWAGQHTALMGQSGEKRGKASIREERGGQQECVSEAEETFYRVLA